eukprot:TRINITY_DN4482_c0_g4_i1.p1 TRINITY_DN4482_c0_g4~~TRINITY_DN4482_c0_g4_i1.p1  ORF type:complete len:314 (-),score=85.58 TRINITY_DN4482_c0_g4_i1:174-1115(-)
MGKLSDGVMAQQQMAQQMGQPHPGEPGLHLQGNQGPDPAFMQAWNGQPGAAMRGSMPGDQFQGMPQDGGQEWQPQHGGGSWAQEFAGMNGGWAQQQNGTAQQAPMMGQPMGMHGMMPQQQMMQQQQQMMMMQQHQMMQQQMMQHPQFQGPCQLPFGQQHQHQHQHQHQPPVQQHQQPVVSQIATPQVQPVRESLSPAEQVTVEEIAEPIVEVQEPFPQQFRQQQEDWADEFTDGDALCLNPNPLTGAPGIKHKFTLPNPYQDDEHPYDTAMDLYAKADWQNAIYAFEAELMKNASNEDAKFQLASAIILAKTL